MKNFFFFLMLCCYAIPTRCLFEVFNRRARHPLNEPAENSSLITLMQSNPRIRNASQVSFIALMIAYLRMNNKNYEPNHLRFKQALSPNNVLNDPLKCIDDGLIGHPGNGRSAPYGILGTSWSWVPKIDKTLIAVDGAKRKTEAWMHWMQKNLRALDNQSSVEQWWNQLRNWIQD